MNTDFEEGIGQIWHYLWYDNLSFFLGGTEQIKKR
jgi:hypothetical protein